MFWLTNEVATCASKLFTSFCTVLQNLAHKIEYCLWQKSVNLCLFYTRRPQGNYFVPFSQAKNLEVQLRFIEAMEDTEFATYTPNKIWNLLATSCNLLRSNCQSKYQCCSGSLQDCHQKNIRFDCNSFVLYITFVFFYLNTHSWLWKPTTQYSTESYSKV